MPSIHLDHIKANWTEDDIIKLLKDDVPNELLDEDNELRYDALIVCVTGHGIEII